ncbi:hypothetical protein ABFS82_06G056000 [Erythranthe guttata]
MERAICQVKTAHTFRSSPILFTPKIGFLCPSTVCLRSVQNQQTVTTLRCSKGDSSSSVLEVDKILMEINNIVEQEQELVGTNDKIDGIVELLECLEREAIMGEDNGTNPTDYNRRALIFDNSSKVFKAIKHTITTSSAV